MIYKKVISAIYNDIVTGLKGITSTPTISFEQLEEDITDERLMLIKEFSLKNAVPRKDMMFAINRIPVKCRDQSITPNCLDAYKLYKPTAWVEIPQIVNDFGADAVEFMGSPDRWNQFKVYTDTAFNYHKYKKRGGTSPFVYIETTPNERNLYNAFIYNCPLLKEISIIALFKDLRQLDYFMTCSEDELDNFSFLVNQIKQRVTDKKIKYYKQLATQVTQNDQTPK